MVAPMPGQSPANLDAGQPPNVSSLLLVWILASNRCVRAVVARWRLFAVLVLLGLAFVWIRAVTLKMVPWLQDHAKTTAVLTNTLMDAFIVLEDVVKTISHVVAEIRNTFRSAAHKKEIPALVLVPLKHLDTAEIQSCLAEYAFAAARYNTGPKAARFLLQSVLNTDVCPVVRAAAPTPLGAILPALNWLVYNPDPNLGVHSCHHQLQFYTINLVAAAMNAGQIMLEIVVPTVAGALIVFVLVAPAVQTVVAVHYQLASLPEFILL